MPICPPGASQVKLYDRFWKLVPDFLFVFHCNVVSFSCRLKVIRHVNFGWGFPIPGKILGVGGLGTPKIWIVVILTPKGTSLGQAASFEPLSVKIGLQVFSNGVTEKKKSLAGPVGRQRVKDDYLCEWKTANFGPRGVETLHPISMKFLAEVIMSTSLTSLPSLRLNGQKVAPPQEREIYTWRDLFHGFYLY